MIRLDNTQPIPEALRGAILALVILGGLVILRQLTRLKTRPLTADPVFWLACLGWGLAFQAGRFMEEKETPTSYTAR